MRSEIQRYIKNINVRRLETNTQRALYRLLRSEGWVKLGEFRIPNAGSRIRDLRKARFTSFDVECRSAASLEKHGDSHTFYYKLNQRNLTLGQVRKVFE